MDDRERRELAIRIAIEIAGKAALSANPTAAAQAIITIARQVDSFLLGKG